MSLRTLLKFRNLDLTKDINDRYTQLFTPGIFYGGSVVPVIGQLAVDIIAPWKLISLDGMVVEETSDTTRLLVNAGQQTVIAIKIVYQDNDDPIITPAAIELSAFNLLSDKAYYVVFAIVNAPADAIVVLDSYIEYASRNIVDTLGRGILRDVVTNVSVLPNAKDNIAGDLYVVADGIGGIPNIYGWNGFSWIILTDAATVTANFSTHQQNLDTGIEISEPIYLKGRIHLSNYEKAALAGTSGTLPSSTNLFIDNADTRIPTQDENNALQGTDGSPADYNRYITEQYPWAIPEEKVVSAFSSVVPFTLTGNTTLGSSVITNLVSTSNIIVGMTVTGVSLPTSPNLASVLTINSLTSITITQQATATVTGTTLTFANISIRMYGATTEGPLYIGRGDSFSTGNFFKFYDTTLNREYMTSSTHPISPVTAVNITAVYYDAACNNLVDPVGLADRDGFCYVDLYLKWDLTPDTSFRILYSKREVMKRALDGTTYYHPYPDAFVRRRMNDAQVPASIIKAIQDIKGRNFDVVPPTGEQNINLRGSVIGTKEYVGAVFNSDNVINDFSHVENVPNFANDFLTNIGIPQNYSFENTALTAISYSYNSIGPVGTVTYGSSVVLTSVIANQDVFIDGSLNEYKVVSVGTNAITIQKRNGKVPRSINTTIALTGSFATSTVVTNIVPSTAGLVVNMAIQGNANVPSGTLIASVDSLTQITLTNATTITSLSQSFVAVPNSQQINFYIKGSIKKDNNPRKINLATLDYLIGRSRIYCRQIQTVPNEFHPVTGNVAFEIYAPLHSATRKEPRVRFYGGFKNREAGSRSRVVVTYAGIISITGFFTDLFLITDLTYPSPTFTVYVDGGTGTSVTASGSVAFSNGFANELDLQNQYLKVASNLSDLIPHTVEIYIGDSTNDFILYGFDLIRNTVSNVLELPGRAFVQSDLFQKNSLDTSISLPRSGIGGSYVRGKGLISTRYINRQHVESTQSTTLFDMDGADDTTCPKGTAANGVPIFGPSTGLTKFSYYQAGDIVKLIVFDGSPTPVPNIEQVLVISSISASSATFSTNIVTDGVSRVAILLHVASTTGDCYDTLKEFNRYMFTEFGVKQLNTTVLSLTGNTTLNSSSITNLSSTSNLFVGMTVSGTYIPIGSMITIINSSSSIAISQNATSTQVGSTLVFASNPVDFSSLTQYTTPNSRMFTLEDGITSVAAYNIKYVNTGIDGTDIALNMIDSTSTFRLRTVASQLDLMVANTAIVSGVLISIDGSPTYSVTFAGGGLTKYTVWTNARYQTHEVVITNAAGLDIVGFITYVPTHSVKIEGSLLATQNVIANYDTANYTYDKTLSTYGLYGSVIPTGSIAIDPYKMGGLFINSGGAGTAWTTSLVFTGQLIDNSINSGNFNPYWGRYTYTAQTNAYFEYAFLGYGFEIDYLAYTNRCYAQVYIDNNDGVFKLATALNFGSATFKGIDTVLGQVDMYNATFTRKKFGINNLTFGLHTVRVICLGTGSRNPSSNGVSGINIGTFYEINSNGYLSYSPSKGFRGKTGVTDFVYGLDWVKDERIFDSVPLLKDELPAIIKVDTQTVALQDVKTDRILLTSGDIFKTITFTVPFNDDNYYIDCMIYRYDSGAVTLNSVTPSGVTSSGFTANFTSIPVTGTYYLRYKATKYF